MNTAKQPRTLAFVNQKGGVSKTTLAAQVAYGLSRMGQNVLAIDLDPQGNLTTALGMQDKMKEGGSSLDVLEKKMIPFFHYRTDPAMRIIPSDIGLAKAEMGFISRADWQFLLIRALSREAEWKSETDFIIIDSPPNLGLLTLNALMATHEVIIPITCDSYALNGVTALTETIQTVQSMNPALTIGGIVASRVDMRRSIDQASIKRLEEMFGDLVFKTRIPENTALKEAGGLGKSIWEHDSRSLAATAITSLCEEIIERSLHEQAV